MAALFVAAVTGQGQDDQGVLRACVDGSVMVAAMEVWTVAKHTSNSLPVEEKMVAR